MGLRQKFHGVFLLCGLVDLTDLMMRELCKYKVVLGHRKHSYRNWLEKLHLDNLG